MTAEPATPVARVVGSPAATRPTPRRTGRRRTGPRTVVVLGGLATALVVAAVVAAGSGQNPLPFGEVVSSVLHRVGLGGSPVTSGVNGELTLWTVRMPRVVMAVVVGAALAVGGALMQGVFGNPLAEPGVVGVASGAAVGAAASIVAGLTFAGSWTIVVCAFATGLVTTLVVYVLAREDGRTEVVTLVLTGIAVNAVAGALLALLMFLGDTQAREQIVFWQLGSLNNVLWRYVVLAAPLTLAGIVAALACASRLDLLSLGERSARHLGVDVERLRVLLIVVVALLTAAAVSFCGIVAFVGLVVPHLVRMVAGPGHRLLLPASALAGSLCLLCADTAARSVVANADLPLGMLTALVGGPFFFWLLRRTRRASGGWA